jgi:hypothetical protein
MDLQKIYPVMAEELGWERYPWPTVARSLRKLTGGRKVYKYIEQHRRCVYFISSTPTKEMPFPAPNLAA